MTFPTTVSFHRVDSSDLLRAEVLERVQRLERILDDILACRVVIETASENLRTGGRYGVYVRLLMPCIEIEAGGKPMLDPRNQDPYLTVADTFDLLTDRLEEFVRLRCRSCSRYMQTHSAP